MKPFSNPAQSGKITPNGANTAEKLVPSNANAYLKPPKVTFSYKQEIITEKSINRDGETIYKRYSLGRFLGKVR